MRTVRRVHTLHGVKEEAKQAHMQATWKPNKHHTIWINDMMETMDASRSCWGLGLAPTGTIHSCTIGEPAMSNSLASSISVVSSDGL